MKSLKFLSLTAASGVVRVGGMGITLALYVVLTRVLEAREFGAYAFVLTVVLLLSAPASLGFPILILRELSKHGFGAEPRKIKGLLLRAGQLSFVATVLFAVFCFLILWLSSPQALAGEFSSLGLGLVLVLPLVWIRLASAAVRAFGLPLIGQLGETALRPLLNVLLVAVAVFLGIKLNAFVAVGLTGAATLLTSLMIIIWLHKNLPVNVRNAVAEFDTKRWVAVAIPLSLASSIAIIKTSTDTVMLGYLSEPEQVALYRVAAQGATLVTLVLQSVVFIISPLLAQAWHGNDLAKVRQLMVMSSSVSFLFAFFVFLVYWKWGAGILQFGFGDVYAEAHSVLVILAGAHAFNCAFGPIGALLDMSGGHRIRLRAATLSALANVILNAAFIPRYGISGAAAATAFSFVLHDAVLSFYAARTGRLAAVAAS